MGSRSDHNSIKEGTNSDLNNYRGITLLSMMGKILVGIINNRLWEVVNKFEILTESQAGCRQGYRTTVQTIYLR